MSVSALSILRSLLLLTALCLPAAGPAYAADAPVLVVFGDSLSAGYGLPRGAGWVDLLQHRLREQGHPHRVVNASVSGETTSGGRRRLTEALARNKPAILILELGANDGLRGQPIDLMQDNLLAMVRAARDKGARVLVIGMRLPPNYGGPYGRQFTQSFADVARQHGLALVPFLMEGFADRRDLFQPDGIHPAAAAQPRMLDTVWKALKPLL